MPLQLGQGHTNERKTLALQFVQRRSDGGKEADSMEHRKTVKWDGTNERNTKNIVNGVGSDVGIRT